jgi:hypothetical protein
LTERIGGGSISSDIHAEGRVMRVLKNAPSIAVAAGMMTLSLVGIAQGSDGQALVLGRDNSAASTTSLNASGTFMGAPPAGIGLWANGTIGLLGSTSGYDVSPPAELVGVVGIGSDEGGYFTGVDSGLTGIAGGDAGAGVTARGPVGLDATGNPAVVAHGASQFSGPVQFSTAGLATIPQGKPSVTLTPGVPITTTTKVLATLQSGGGTFKRVGRNLSAGTITLYLSSQLANRRALE